MDIENHKDYINDNINTSVNGWISDVKHAIHSRLCCKLMVKLVIISRASNVDPKGIYKESNMQRMMYKDNRNTSKNPVSNNELYH